MNAVEEDIYILYVRLIEKSEKTLSELYIWIWMFLRNRSSSSIVDNGKFIKINTIITIRYIIISLFNSGS